MIEIKVPAFGESIQEVQISQWLKKEGDWVAKDEDFVELESEKATQALPSPESGTLHLMVAVGAFAKVGDVIATLVPGQKGASAPARSEPVASPPAKTVDQPFVMPAAERVLHENRLTADQVPATGPGNRLQKSDVLQFVESQAAKPTAAPASSAPMNPLPAPVDAVVSVVSGNASYRQEETKPMSMMRRTIANRLVEAQQNAALLTTFNEIDMMPVMDLRSKYKDSFGDKHGVKLGFMSFFAKATVEALKRFPAINAEVRGNDVIYRHYYDIGIAIGGGKGLVVPILRNIEKMSFAEIERAIGHFATLAKENKLKPTDLEGGTFTISNGGVYGSLLSTPIVNPPQSGILGLHAIQDRPVAIDGQVVIRPMMYVALTYDHRIVDGREAVGFLRTIKEVLEEPARLFLEV